MELPLVISTRFIPATCEMCGDLYEAQFDTDHLGEWDRTHGCCDDCNEQIAHESMMYDYEHDR